MAKPTTAKGPVLRHKIFSANRINLIRWVSQGVLVITFAGKGKPCEYKAFAHNYEASTDGKTWLPVTDVFPQPAGLPVHDPERSKKDVLVKK